MYFIAADAAKQGLMGQYNTPHSFSLLASDEAVVTCTWLAQLTRQLLSDDLAKKAVTHSVEFEHAVYRQLTWQWSIKTCHKSRKFTELREYNRVFDKKVQKVLWIIFTVRQHRKLCRTLYLQWQIPSVCPSVTLFDTAWYHVKTTPATIMRSSVEDSPMTLVSSWLTPPRNSKGNTGNGAPNERGLGKILNFQPISRRISETVQDRTIVTMTD